MAFSIRFLSSITRIDVRLSKLEDEQILRCLSNVYRYSTVYSFAFEIVIASFEKAVSSVDGSLWYEPAQHFTAGCTVLY